MITNSIDDVISVLRHSTRVGSDVDSPEGLRYIQISDTLALQMADIIESHLDDLDLQQKADAARAEMNDY